MSPIVKVRLQKALAQAGVASRRKAEELIAAGKVEVNGTIVTEQGVQVEPDRDLIRVNGRLLETEKKVYFVLYKPPEVVTTLSDPQGRTTVKEYLKDVRQRVFAVGRLDYDAEGALIVTNDGDLANRLMHPRFQVPRVYMAKVKGVPDAATMAQAKKGVRLEDVAVHSALGMALVVQRSADVSWRGTGAPESRRSGVFPRKATGRYASAHADATHFSNVKGCVRVENCLFDNNDTGNGWGSGVAVGTPDVLIANCTIVRNHGENAGSAATIGPSAGIWFDAAAVAEPGLQVVNCLFDGNYQKTEDQVLNWSAHPTADADNLAAAFTTCAFTAGELPVADDETKAMLVADPGFTDDGTYRLTKKTALRGKGTYQDWMDGTTDLYGMPRVGVQNEVEPGCCAAPKVYGFMLLVR